MSKTIEIPDIAQWEETDSELAKYTIQSLSSLIKNQEEQLKANDLMINELINRIDKAIEYIKHILINDDLCNIEKLKELDKVIDILRGETNDRL